MVSVLWIVLFALLCASITLDMQLLLLLLLLVALLLLLLLLALLVFGVFGVVAIVVGVDDVAVGVVVVVDCSGIV